METTVYHRRIGCVRAYLAIRGNTVWSFMTGQNWREIGGRELLEAVTDEAVKYGDLRYIRLPNHEQHLPPIPAK